MKILIIGKGSVGNTLAQFHPDDALAYHDPKIGEYALTTTAYDVAHITYPMTDLLVWVHTTQEYIKGFPKVKWWMIHSTILPEALDYLPNNILIVYSPIRATEAIMDSMVAQYRKFWAVVNRKTFKQTPEQWIQMREYIQTHFPDPLEFTNAKTLALGKLLETADFGMQIAFAQMVADMCGYEDNMQAFDEAYREYRRYSEYGADYQDIQDGAPMEWIPRGLFTPNVIGGKCVMQNLKLVHDAGLGDRALWQWICDSNERQKRRELHG